MYWRLSGLIVFIMVGQSLSIAQEPPDRKQLMKLVLIQYDLKKADESMTIHDHDESGVLDKFECERLPWKSQIHDFDLDKNGEITHLEIAIRQAFLRSLDDITEFDINNVNKFLMRYDKNRNGQLEKSEVLAGGWPTEPEEYDKDRDGIITAREMTVQFAFNRVVRRELGIEAVDQTRAMSMVRTFDTDGDKKLSPDEYDSAALPKPVADFDRDEDRKLGIMELATMFAVHRRDMGLSKPDVKKINGLFSSFDIDGDGKIPIGPQIDLTTGKLPEGVKLDGPIFAPTVRNRLVGYDENKDQVVTRQEVEAHFAKVRKERGYAEEEFQKAKQMITRYDANRSKHIEEYELDPAVKAGQLPKNLLTKADRDQNGQVGLDELARYFASVKK